MAESSSSSHPEDTKSLIRDLDHLSGHHVVVYKKRWYILFVFALLGMGQAIMYNTWSPIQSTARAVYKWEAYMIDLIPALGCIAPCFTIIPVGWMMDVKGLRISVLLAAGCQFFGAVLRCVPTGGNMTVITVLIFVGQVLSALCAPVPLSGGVLLSATWFPIHERTMSTAIISAASSVGFAIPFLLGPHIVEDVGEVDFNTWNVTQRDHYLGQINQLLYAEAGFMAVIMLMVVVHYPAKPPLPPSRSSGIRRIDPKNGFKSLLKNRTFLLVAVLYGASYGIYSGWSTILGQNLEDFDLGQTFAGWLGFIAMISGAVSGVSFSILSGRFIGHLKDFLLVFVAFASFSILIVCLIFSKVIPFNKVLMCVIFGLTGFFINGTVPFFFELGAEVAYPVAEGIATSAIKFTDYFLQAIFLIFSMKHFGVKWMTWVIMVSSTTTTVLLYFVKEKYNRLNVDVHQDRMIVS